MRCITIIMIFWLSCLFSFAQGIKSDSSFFTNSFLDTIKLPNVPFSKFDSLKNKVNLSQLQSSTGDSVQWKFDQKDSLLALSSKYEQQISDAKSRLDSVHFKIQNKLDSLLKMPNPDTVLTKMLSSLTSQTDSLRNKLDGLKGKIKTPDEIKKMQTGVETSIHKTENGINEKLALLQKNGMTGIPKSLNTPSLSSLKMPGVESLKMPSGNLPNLSMPNVEVPNQSLGDVKIPDANLPSTDLNLPKINQPSLPSLNSLGDVGEYTEKVSEITSKVGGYQEDLKNLSTGNVEEIKEVPTLLEKNAMDIEQMEGLQKQMAEADQMKRYFDPEVAKEEALTKLKQEAINHFAGHEEELKAAMMKLSKLKSKFPDAEGVLHLFAKRQHPLRGKPIIERFIPGFNFQFQKQESFWLDVNPQIGYMISRRFTAGLGWNERLAYNFDDWKWDSKNRVYGIRSFVHFKIKEKFYLKADVECLNSPLRVSKVNADIIGRAWAWSYLAGIKRDFQLSRHINGNVQMLYNVYDPYNRSPYANRINARLGIEFRINNSGSDKFNSFQ